MEGPLTIFAIRNVTVELKRRVRWALKSPKIARRINVETLQIFKYIGVRTRLRYLPDNVEILKIGP